MGDHAAMEGRQARTANAAFGVSPTPAPDMSRLGAQPGRIARRNQNTVFVCWVDTFWPSPEPLCIHSEGNFVVTSPDITFGADEVSASKEVLAKGKSAIWLKSRCANPPGPFAALRLVH